MNPRYIDAPLVDLDTPEPTPTPRALRPRYVDGDPEAPPARPRIPAAARNLPAYQYAQGGLINPGQVFIAPLGTPQPPPAPRIDPLAGTVQIAFDPSSVQQVAQVAQDWLTAMWQAAAHVAERMQQLATALRRAGVLPDQPPDDPRARALWLRQHRNTGPSRDVVHQHRPRQLNTGRRQSTSRPATRARAAAPARR